MVVDTLPTGWRAAYIPNPTNDATATLIIDSSSAATPGDYPIRISGRASGLVAETSLIVRVRIPQLSISVVTPGPAVAPGGTTRFILGRSVH